MRYKFLQCAGFEPSVHGMMLSYGKTSFDNFSALYSDIERLAAKLAPMDGGHNKFLEQIQYWILVQAPLFWWKQADTYRVGISKSSESTMHKSWKNGLTQEMFEYPVFQDTLDALNDVIREYGSPLVTADWKKFLEKVIANNMPDGYLQTRLLNVNAKCLRNMYFQRREHKLREWRDFCAWIKDELPYGDLITAEKEKE